MPTPPRAFGRSRRNDLFRLVTALAAVAGMTACESSSALEPQLEATLQLSAASVKFTALTESKQLTATVVNAAGEPLGDPGFQWSSSNPQVASVNGTGLITARSSGQAEVTVRATCCDLSKTVPVTVQQVAASLAVSSDEVQFTALTQTAKLEARAVDGAGTPIEGLILQWTSGDPSVATVDEGGMITARAVGATQVVVSASCCGLADTVAVSVEQVPTNLIVTPDQAEMDVGETLRLEAKAEDAYGNAIQNLTYTTLNEAVVAVTADGVVEAKTEGAAVVEVSVSGVRVQANLNVRGKSNTPISEVRASVDSYQFKAVGEMLDAGAEALDASGNVVHGIAFDWSSSKKSVATVDKNGVITAVGEGSATITVSAPCCGKADQIAVSVASPVATSLVLIPGTADLQPGHTVKLSVKDNQGNSLSGATMAFSSSKPAVATVASDGTVSAVSAGSATITATAGSLSGTAAIAVSPAAATSLVLNPGTAYLHTGDTVKLSVRDNQGNSLAGATIAFSSSKPAVAKVASDGTVTAAGAGSATITATSGSLSGSATITVTSATPPPPTINVARVQSSKSSVRFTAVGDTAHLNASAFDGTGALVQGVSFGWNTSNSSVVTVDSMGLLRARGVGTASVVVAALCCSAADTVAVEVVLQALAAGTATAAAGNATVALSATPPTGGEPPYTYRWYRSTSSGFTPGSGNLLSGLSSLSGTDSGVSNGTRYYYRLVASDGAGAAVKFAEINATPTAPAPAAPQSALHPNEPAGMTVLGSADGSIAYNGTGAFGIAGFTSTSFADNGNVHVVDDASNPTGSGKAVRFEWKAANQGVGKGNYIFPGTGWRELYIMLRVVKPTSWPDAQGHKWFYLVPKSAGNVAWGEGIWSSQEPNDNWRVLDGDNHQLNAGPVLTMRAPNEMAMEYHCVAESSAHANDGRCTIWLNGRQVGSDDQMVMAASYTSYEPLFARLQLYVHANTVYADTHYDVRELYVSAKN